MKTRLNSAIALLLSGTLAIWAQSSEAGNEALVVIVNKANPSSSIGLNELRPIFQTTKTRWSNGGDAIPFNLPYDNGLRQEFDRAVLGLDPDRIARYWQDRKIRGGARPPKQLPSVSTVLAAVAANPGAVGYVNASAVNGTVKVVAKIMGGNFNAP
jgi:ABC-type phosphate transport system substrate-binding protein